MRPMTGMTQVKFRARFAETPEDLACAQALRYRRFRAGRAPGADHGAAARDCDAFDALARHVLVEDLRSGDLVCCFRALLLADGSAISRSYSAQFYDLSRLAGFKAPMLELGRFCIAEAARDPDVLRVAWGFIGGMVEAHGVELLFGCSSFHGTETAAHEDAFALLKENHLAPRRWLPRVKAPSVFRYARKLRLKKPDLAAAMRGMPPLLRTYLLMGGWVSDHAVVDRELDTLHVFTGVETRRVPAARRRMLRPAV